MPQKAIDHLFNASISDPAHGARSARVPRRMPTKGELLTWASEHNKRCQDAYAAVCSLIGDAATRVQVEEHLGALRLGAMGVGMIQSDISEGRYR